MPEDSESNEANGVPEVNEENVVVEIPEETSLEFAFENLDYDKVMESPEMSESVKTEVHTGIVSKLGVPPDCVRVEISKGSVVVNSTIGGPGLGKSALELKQMIDDAGDSFLHSISESVAKIPNIKDAALDPALGFLATGLKTLFNAVVAKDADAPEANEQTNNKQMARGKSAAQIEEEGDAAMDAILAQESAGDLDPDAAEISGVQTTKSTMQVPLEDLIKNAEFNMRKHACTLWNGEDYIYREVWTTTKRQLAEYGEGVYLYFQFMYYMAILFLVQLVVSVPALITYGLGNMVSDSNKLNQYIATFSIANLGYCPGGVCRTDNEFRDRPVHDGSTLSVKEWTQGIGILDGISMFIFIFATMIYTSDWMWRSIAHVDEELTTVSDFAIQVKKLPTKLKVDHEKYEEKLKAHFEKRLAKVGVEEPSAIQEISILRNYGGAIHHFKTKGGLLHQRQSIELALDAAREKADKKKIEKAEKALKKINKKIEAVDKTIGPQATMTQEQRAVCGAFIIFNRKEYRDEILYQYRLSDSLWYKFCRCHPTKRFEGAPILVKRACEPLDIIWENADYSHHKRLVRRLITLIVALGLLIASTGLLVALQSMSTNITKTTVEAQPVWVVKHVAGSNTRCLTLCGITMYAASNCNEADGHSGEWDVKQIFDARGNQLPTQDVGRFIDLKNWPDLNETSQAKCTNKWESPACEISLDSDRAGDWIAIEFSQPRAVQCVSMGQHVNQISSNVDLFQCSAGGEELVDYETFDPEKQCVPLKRLYPAIDKRDEWIAPTGNMAVKMDAQCQTGSFISFDVAEDAKAATDTPEQDPVLSCYCATQVLEVGISFRLPPYNTEGKKLCEEWSRSENMKLAKMVAVVAVVLCLNTVLTYTFEFLINWERHASQVDTTNSRQWKLLCAQFINTGVLYLIVNANFLGEFDWFPFIRLLKIGQGDFEDFRPTWFTAVGASICITVGTCIVSLPVPTLLVAFIVNPIVIRISSVGLLTQETLNSVYQLPEWHLSLKLAQCLTVIFVVIMYAGGMPALYLVGFIYCIVTYWVEKWVLLKGSSKPPKYSHRPIARGLYLIPVAVFFHVVLTLWMYGNQNLFPSEWSMIIASWEATVDMTKEEYEVITRDFENGSDEDKKSLFNEYLHARMLDFGRDSCWFLLILFSVLIIVFFLAILIFFVLRPLLSPCEQLMRSIYTKRKRHDKIDLSKSVPFSEVKEKVIAHGHETSYLLAYSPNYQDAFVGMTGEIGSAPDLSPPRERSSLIQSKRNMPKPPGVFKDPLTYVMLLLSLAAGGVIVFAIMWNDI